MCLRSSFVHPAACVPWRLPPTLTSFVQNHCTHRCSSFAKSCLLNGSSPSLVTGACPRPTKTARCARRSALLDTHVSFVPADAEAAADASSLDWTVDKEVGEGEDERLVLDSTQMAALLVFVQRALLDPLALRAYLNPVRVPVDVSLLKTVRGKPVPAVSAAVLTRKTNSEQMMRAKGEREEESETDWKARLRIGALDALQWILGTYRVSSISSIIRLRHSIRCSGNIAEDGDDLNVLVCRVDALPAGTEVRRIASTEARCARWIPLQNAEHGVVKNYVPVRSSIFFFTHVSCLALRTAQMACHSALDLNAYHGCRPILPGHVPVVHNLEYKLLHRSTLAPSCLDFQSGRLGGISMFDYRLLIK
jgi:hypothetical protein